jgi:N-acetyl-beta-hexosaminidase
MYTTLEQIFDEFQDIFKFDSFHMGGDEVWLIDAKKCFPEMALARHLSHMWDYICGAKDYRNYKKLQKLAPKYQLFEKI